MSSPTNGCVELISNAQCHLRTSSSALNGSQHNALLNISNNATGIADAWVASVCDNNQFFVAGSEVPRTFRAVAIQGRGDADEWVKTYRIRYSLDNVVWTEYRNMGAIQGNTDRNTVVYHWFDTPIRARSIAIHPITWNNKISLRCEFYCVKNPSHITVQQGHTDTGGSIISGADTVRGKIVSVVFNEEFTNIPTVTVSLERIHESIAQPLVNNPLAVLVQAKNITTKGFDCDLVAEAYTKTQALSMSWIAIGRE